MGVFMKKVLTIVSFILLLISISSVFMLFNKINTKNETENEIIVEQSVDFSQLSYLSFGSSTSAGTGAGGILNSFPNGAGKILGCSVNNRGVGGSTLTYDVNDTARRCVTEDVIDFTKNNNRVYDIVSIYAGSNDKTLSRPLGSIGSSATNETIYGSLKLIADTLTAKYPNALIIFITPMKYLGYDVVNSNGYILSDVAKAIHDVGAEYNIPVLDMYNTMPFETDPNGMYHPDCDGQHPIKEFVTKYMAPELAQFIKDNYKK